MNNKYELKCSFCQKEVDKVKKIIRAKGVAICQECVDACNDILSIKDNTSIDILTPKEIYIELNKYIIGQEKTKRVLSVSLYNHLKRISLDNSQLEKSNVLLLGSTGTGKTLFAKTIAKILNLPIAICDATSLTEAGYVGDDVENILLKLLKAANNDIELAEKGIVFIDEIDKIAKKGYNSSITRDVSGEGVQQALLKIIEGTDAYIPPNGGRKHPYQENIKMNTENILFICGGAFSDIENIVLSRLKKTKVGFQKNDINQLNIWDEVKEKDLIKYGLIPEFVGRLPVVSALSPLTKKELYDIIVKPQNAILKQYVKLFKALGYELRITKEAIYEIVEEASELELGARGVKNIFEKVCMDIEFELDYTTKSQKIVITREMVKKNKAIMSKQKAM